MKAIFLALSVAAYAAPITATFTCDGFFSDGESVITVAGAVYGRFDRDLGCGLTLFDDRLSMTVGGGAVDGGGSLNGFRLEGSGPGTISNLRAIFDLDPFGNASGYFSVLRMAPEWFQYVEVLHVEASGTYTVTRNSFESGSLSLFLDTDRNAIPLPEPDAVIVTTLGLGVLVLNRDRLRIARRQHRIA